MDTKKGGLPLFALGCPRNGTFFSTIRPLAQALFLFTVVADVLRIFNPYTSNPQNFLLHHILYTLFEIVSLLYVLDLSYIFIIPYFQKSPNNSRLFFEILFIPMSTTKTPALPLNTLHLYV